MSCVLSELVCARIYKNSELNGGACFYHCLLINNELHFQFIETEERMILHNYILYFIYNYVKSFFLLFLWIENVIHYLLIFSELHMGTL